MEAIVAMARNRVIGVENHIPWHIPEDFRWFKQLTMGHTLLMGRRTFESIGHPLPGRQTIVLSHSWMPPVGVGVVRSVDELLAEAKKHDRLFVCGGANIYKQLLPFCTDLYLTLVKDTPKGDAFIPPFEHLFPKVTTLRSADTFDILHYEREKQN